MSACIECGEELPPPGPRSRANRKYCNRCRAKRAGKAAHEQGTAHTWTPEEARRTARFTPENAPDAGRKGAKTAHAKGSAYRLTPEDRQRGLRNLWHKEESPPTHAVAVREQAER